MVINNQFKPLWIDSGLGPVLNPELEGDELIQAQEEERERYLGILWQAATSYESSRISGSAPSLVALGCIQGKPKCLAVRSWVQSIWALYYSRKPLVTYSWDNSLIDFSQCGEIPYSIQELMEEVTF